MSAKRFKSVWDALEDTPSEAANMKARAELMNEIIELIKEQHLTQTQAAARLCVTQPRVSDLMRGKIDLFSLDTLINMLAAVGRRVEIKVKKVAVAA